MSVTITSYVPTFAGGTVTTGTLIVNAPNQGVNGQLAMLFTAADQILIGTGANTFNVEAFGDVLDGTFGPGYSYNELIAPVFTLDFNAQRLANLAEPTALQDAATKNYVDVSVGAIGGPFLPTSGGTMLGDLTMSPTTRILVDDGSATTPGLDFALDIGNGLFRPAPDTLALATATQERLRIEPSGKIGVSTANYETLVVTDDAIPNKKYVDDSITTAIGGVGPFLPLSGGVMTGAIVLAADPVAVLEPATKQYTDTADAARLRLDGSDTMTGTLVMGTNPITGVVDPTALQDAATKNYVDTEIVSLSLNGTGPYLRLSGADTMVGALDMGTNKIGALADPTLAQDGATKNYVDTQITALGLVGVGPYLPLAGGAMTGTLALAADPTFATEAATKNYVDTEITALGLTATGPFLRLSGADTMTGALNMGTNLINNVADPTGAQDASTKNYVDTEITSLSLNGTGPYLRLSGVDTMTGALVMGTNQISGLGDPTLAQDGATKNYIDTEITALGLVGTGPYLKLDGTTPMTGNLNMAGNDIDNIGNLNLGDHIFTTTTYESGQGGNAHKIRLAAAPTAASPTYSFVTDDNTGILNDGADGVIIAGNGAAQLTVNPTEINAHNKKVVNAADPTTDQDLATKSYVDSRNSVRILATVPGIDLVIAGVKPLYTVPVGEVHIITDIILRITSYVPGAGPSTITLNAGTSGLYDQLVDSMQLNPGVVGAADMAIYLLREQYPSAGPQPTAPTPNAGQPLNLNVTAITAGSTAAFVATAYVLGFSA